MRKTGLAVLPLHLGHAPGWLTSRMKKLSDEMVYLMVDEYGVNYFLNRLSDPYWFQAFGCVLGFDWHSSGLTTVVTGILKDVLRFDKHGVEIAGGKGGASKKAPQEIEFLGEKVNLSSSRIGDLQYASKMCAKVDTVAIQAGYPIYHHTLFLTEKGDWCVIQQGINTEDRTARRYHWLSSHVQSFIVEPHDAIVGDTVIQRVLNMTARDSDENRKTCVDLVKEPPGHIVSSIRKLIPPPAMSLDHWVNGATIDPSYQGFSMPRRLNWDLFTALYENQPVDYEALIAFPGVGPAAARALALVSQMVYGKPPSWRDPVKFTFAHGGKDGVPYPVDRDTYDNTIKMLKEIVGQARVDGEERRRALRRLAQHGERNMLVKRF